MAITTHAQLLTAIADYTTRNDLTSVDDDFVLMCESRLNYGSDDPVFPTPPLRVRQMEERATASITGEYLALPTDFLQVKSLRLTSTAQPRMLRPLVTNNFDAQVDGSLGGTPFYYDIVGGELRFNPIATSGTVEMVYYEKLPPLVSNDPNWLLTASPNIYLNGCLLEAAIYIQEDRDIEKYGRIFSGLVHGMNTSGKQSSQPTPLVARSDVRPASRRYARA